MDIKGVAESIIGKENQKFQQVTITAAAGQTATLLYKKIDSTEKNTCPWDWYHSLNKGGAL